jgi:hypothetical protein
VNWQLLAAYLGRQFTIQGLLLMNKNSGETMEIMAQDCAWRVKHHDAWSKASDVQAELKKSAKDGATNFDIKDVKEKLGNSATFKSTLVMNMRSQDAMQEVAKLVVHCKPQHHLDFKVKMSHTDDITHGGGELGVGPDANSNYLFLFSKQGVRDMKTDREFKAGVKGKRWPSEQRRPIIPEFSFKFFVCSVFFTAASQRPLELGSLWAVAQKQTSTSSPSNRLE